MTIYTVAFKTALYVMAAVSFGLMILLVSHEGHVEALREQNRLLHSIVTLQQEKLQLQVENCDSTHMVEGLCEYTLTHMVERLGLQKQLEPVLGMALWKRLKGRVDVHPVGMGGGD